MYLLQVHKECEVNMCTGKRHLGLCFHLKWIATAVPSEACVCSRLIAVIAGSNSVEGMDIRLLSLLCCVGSDLCD
jgi:hypothetical protein